MVPFDPAGLFEALGGRDKALAALDGFFHNSDGKWAVTKAGPLHAELDNEPSVASPWLYDFAGAPWKTQGAVRAAMRQIWTNSPSGISGNDDLGEMSSWYVWSAMGLYPLYPGRADLVIGSPLFPEDWIEPRTRSDPYCRRRRSGRRALCALAERESTPDDPAMASGGFRAERWGASLLAFIPARRALGAQPQDAPPSYGPGN